MLGIGGLLVGVRAFCGDAGLELEPVRCVEPSGDAGRLLDLEAVGAVAGRLRRSELLPPSPRISAFALTGPPRKAPMPPEPRGALLTGTPESAGPAGAELPRTLLRTPPTLPPPGAGLAVWPRPPPGADPEPLRLPRLG
mmetsp:Transcript_40199/g.114886  ORF Transcript_40199/g.114886 Transcript_40199/m.114886 type:complete len:139 (+) Transcript_40199:33-449(+)